MPHKKHMQTLPAWHGSERTRVGLDGKLIASGSCKLWLTRCPDYRHCRAIRYERTLLHMDSAQEAPRQTGTRWTATRTVSRSRMSGQQSARPRNCGVFFFLPVGSRYPLVFKPFVVRGATARTSPGSRPTAAAPPGGNTPCARWCPGLLPASRVCAPGRAR